MACKLGWPGKQGKEPRQCLGSHDEFEGAGRIDVRSTQNVPQQVVPGCSIRLFLTKVLPTCIWRRETPRAALESELSLLFTWG